MSNSADSKIHIFLSQAGTFRDIVQPLISGGAGTRRRNLDTNNLPQSILFVLPSMSFEKNKNPVIMKKSRTELSPKCVYRLEGGAFH